MLRPQTATGAAGPRNSDQAGTAFISGGRFLMHSDGHSPEEVPAHCVSVSRFWIDRIPVRPFGPTSPHSGLKQHPAVHVDSDAEDHARWAGEELPTAVDFEFAARGGPESSCDPPLPDIAIPRKELEGTPQLCALSYCRRYRPAARHSEPVDTSTNDVGFRGVICEPRSAR